MRCRFAIGQIDDPDPIPLFGQGCKCPSTCDLYVIGMSADGNHV
jgi:hypothetical protein